MDDKELWRQAHIALWDIARQDAKERYEEEYGGGSWEEADKYEREDYVWGSYHKIKGLNCWSWK